MSARSSHATSDSKSPSPFPMESLEQMENDELMNYVEEVERTNEALQKETQIFEKYLKRIDPKDFHQRITMANAHLTQHDVGKVRKKGKSRVSSTAERGLMKLSVEQKCDIATKEVDILREEMARKDKEYEQLLDSYKATTAEAEIRHGEVKKETYEFERDVSRGGVNPRIGKIMAERVMKFYDDKLRSKDTMIEKLRLKNTSLRAKCKKLILHLKQKEESGEVRHEVDFKQLKIENKRHSEHYEEKNQELLKLKLTAGNTLQVLNSYKKKLHALSVESAHLDNELKQRQELLEKIEAETRTATKEREEAEKVNKEARRKLEDYRVPEVMEYVKERALLCDLTKTVRAWGRKVEISEMALQGLRKQWRKLQNRADNPWNALDPMRATT
ncbi:cilia- and flagella-associated protein 263-like [Dysidea avara]|uniref:cilia- and flagella-associated protein 263-like n=1 Tax=Dysidea avara TaxID=196820 RepID=UPI003331A09A